MSKEDTNSIKYILEEMDPAEMVEFERQMASDPDLRIEVETIRRMNGKLNALPDLKPPKHVTDSILSLSAEQSGKSKGFKSGYFLSAAVVILGLTTGSLILQSSFNDGGSDGNSSASLFSSGAVINKTEVTQNANLKPWVDRQDVLRLNGFESVSNSSPIQSNRSGNSFNKLKPVGKFPDLHPYNRSLQLTGSNR